MQFQDLFHSPPGDFCAVDDLSLIVPDGSFFALLGPSGCGKTTTLRMIAGLEEPSAGTISIGDTDITTQKSYRRNVNTVFQNYALFPHLTIFEKIPRLDLRLTPTKSPCFVRMDKNFTSPQRRKTKWPPPCFSYWETGSTTPQPNPCAKPRC